MADQDMDGSHIKGLLFNFFHHFWPELLEFPNFIQALATPLVKVTRGKDTKEFYSLSEFEQWKEKTNGGKGWGAPKYYKGLGTSDKTEARKWFVDMNDKLITYTSKDTGSAEPPAESDDESQADSDASSSDESSSSESEEEDEEESEDEKTDKKGASKLDPTSEAIRLAFDKKRANDRKKWLSSYNRDRVLDNNQKLVSYSQFVHDELIHFSNGDNIRSIPSAIDGLKPSQRKILYAMLQLNLDGEKKRAKVAQLVGEIAKMTDYHHGEQSLSMAIINMAQDFTGTNNINLLFPSGQFGSRLEGDDAASPRYIFTYLEALTKLLFRAEDAPVLRYNKDDNEEAIEPEFYVPILPMILVNGAKGIGTGYSTDIPGHNPIDIVQNLLRMMDKKEPKPMVPFYRGYEGTIREAGPATYNVRGIYQVVNENTIRITELPVGQWNVPYKKYLTEKLMEGKDPLVADYDEIASDVAADFTIHFSKGKLRTFAKNMELMEKKLRITKQIKTTNMHAYNTRAQIHKYASPSDILKEFYKVRIDYYVKRKEWHQARLDKELELINYIIKFIEFYLAGKITFTKEKSGGKRTHLKRQDVIDQLVKLKFPELRKQPMNPDCKSDYSYLTEIRIFDLTEEEMARLRDKLEVLEKERKKYTKNSAEDLWRADLEEFLAQYKKWADAKLAVYAELKEKDYEKAGKGDKGKKKTTKKAQSDKPVRGGGRKAAPAKRASSVKKTKKRGSA
jgi:DNA topoisomerase-2